MSERCGILLAGGKGTRLMPSTTTISKQLLPVYDKPMIYYPLATLMKAGVKDVLIIVSNKINLALFMDLFHTGAKFGMNIQYKVQHHARGIADAFLVGEEFIDGRPVVLALGDNIFYGSSLDEELTDIEPDANVVFGCEVADPTAYGVAKFGNGLFEVVEKPRNPPSNYAVPGLYFYDNTVVEKAKTLKPSPRNELEITDLTNLYAKNNELHFVELPNIHWFDCGTHEGLLEASQFVHAVQKRTGKIIGDIEGIAKANGWLDLPF